MCSVLREWAPLSDLFNRLPSKIQNGFFTQNIRLTCIDVLPEFIALGTNFGLVYWYDRKKKDLQKLRCENSNYEVTAVKVISTVDYMVASGNVQGNISIFQVPKSHPDALPESLRPKNKQVERYSVSELHNAPITALEWSKNGMKLFSGDKTGHIILTEIDFYMHLCKSVEILNESYEVVQLSYYQQNLLVSTTYRSIVCRKEDKWKVSQVGRKDRKVLGNFGGTFYQNSERPNDLVLYCTRPGLRIWLSDLQGSVQQTFLFKDILNHKTPEIALINPISKNLRKLLPQKEASFGLLLPFANNLLVTYSNDVVYILDPKAFMVIATISHLRRVLSVASYKDELFILEGERSLIRISEKPEPYYDCASTISPVSSFLPLTTSIKDLTHKLQPGNIIAAIPPLGEPNCDLNIHTDTTSIMNAEEATESPRRAIQVSNEAFEDKLKTFYDITEQEFDDNILYKHRRRKKNRTKGKSSTSNTMATSMISCSSNSSEEREFIKPNLMSISTIGVLPDLRSPESIKHDIESKEKALADVLCFDKLKINISNVDIKRDTEDDIKNDPKNTLKENLENHSKIKEKVSYNAHTPLVNGINYADSAFNKPVEDDHVAIDMRGYKSALPKSGFAPKLPSTPVFNGYKENTAKVSVYGSPSASSNPDSINIPSSSSFSSLVAVPVCTIPTDWQLKSVKLNTREHEASMDLSEWEII